MKVAHIIVGLGTGGAETMLIKLLENSPAEDLQQKVFCLSPIGPRGLALLEKGYEVEHVKWSEAISGMKKYSPDILIGWMFHGALLSAWIKKQLPNLPVVWNIRYANLPGFSLKTKLVVKLLQKLSQLPDLIIYNSEAGKKYHEDIGYHSKSSKIIVNGFNLNIFKTDKKFKNIFIQNNSLSENAFIFGMVARFDKFKNQTQFIPSALKFLETVDDHQRPIYFCFLGKEMDHNNKEIRSIISKHPKKDRIILLGEQHNIEEFFPCFDVHCLYSTTEGFPNVVGEAMACGVPNVATPVGDVEKLIDSTGWIVPINDSETLINTLNKIYNTPQDEIVSLGEQARKRIEDHYEISRVATNYLGTFFKLLT